MPALWSPEDLATRFAAYIEELQDLFAMHGLHHGSPDDLRHLATQLEIDSALNEELAALVRSMVLREGGSIPHTDLLEIVAIAVAGPRMDAAGGDLQHAVRQLLAFLHSALRRPWNELPGEERLNAPAEDLRAEAARELREAAARIEAEAQSSAQENKAPISTEDAVEEYSLRGNVIPFGRARAVFSRLARIDGTEFDGPLEENGALSLSADTAGIVDSEAFKNDSAANHRPLVVEQDVSGVSPRTPIATAYDLALAQSKVRDKAAGLDATAPRSTEAAVESKDVGDAQETNEAAKAVPEHAPTLQFAPLIDFGPPAPEEVVFTEFDDEPPLPVTRRPNHIAWISGVAATVLIAAGLVFAVRARTGNPETAAVPQQSIAEVSRPAKPPATIAAAPVLKAPALAADTAKPKPNLSGSDDSNASHEDGDNGYVAPPYSSMPPQQTPATTVAVNQPEAQSVAPPSTSPAPTLEHRETPLQQVSEVHTEPLRPRDPDASIAGDPPAEGENVALAEVSSHPSIPPTVMAENLVSGPIPDYPRLAKLAHADGPVVLHAEITPAGAVSDARVISGHFLLRRAAEAAVRHWRYRPYQVDGKPVAVSTTITVHFRNGH